jgi:hypothetical protein
MADVEVSGSGGAVFSINSKAVLTELVVTRAKAATGGAFSASNGSTVRITGSKLDTLSASQHGGILFAYESDVDIQTSTFQKFDKGGILADLIRSLRIVGSTFAEGVYPDASGAVVNC